MAMKHCPPRFAADAVAPHQPRTEAVGQTRR